VRLAEFYKIYSGFFVLGPAVEKIYSQVRLMLSPTVSLSSKAVFKNVTLTVTSDSKVKDTPNSQSVENKLLSSSHEQ
jgi:hypothetical protein